MTFEVEPVLDWEVTPDFMRFVLFATRFSIVSLDDIYWTPSPRRYFEESCFCSECVYLAGWLSALGSAATLDAAEASVTFLEELRSF